MTVVQAVPPEQVPVHVTPGKCALYFFLEGLSFHQRKESWQQIGFEDKSFSFFLKAKLCQKRKACKLSTVRGLIPFSQTLCSILPISYTGCFIIHKRKRSV